MCDVKSSTLATATNLALVPKANWEYDISGIVGVGFAGTYLLAAGGVADPWLTKIPGAYGAGTAGKILGDSLTGHIPQTGDSYLRIGALGAGLTALAPATTALSNLVWTNAKAAFLDVGVSSRAAAATALDSGVWTNARAVKIDHLDMDVSGIEIVIP